MWMEWPSFTYTPLVIGSSRDPNVESTSFGIKMLDYVYEIFCLVFAVCCGLGIVFLRYIRKPRGKNERILRQVGYPVTFDLLYIPFISTFARLALCPTGYIHLPLTGGATCDCIDRFGISWAIGIIGFVLLYTSALHYKMYIEPTGTAMEFRFQTSFQIIMVMARTLNPVLAMLASDISDEHVHIIICFAMLGLMLFLLVYSYRTQPCIGSGRIANNIRVLTFISSAATSFFVALILLFDRTISQMYYALSILPLIWLTAWIFNHIKATPLNIPNLPILDLLQLPSKQAKTVAVIAALYVDAIKVRVEDHDAIVSHLQKIAKLSRNGELLSRVYAIRFLWYCHVENFNKGKTEIGEPNEATAISSKLWFKDLENPSREELKEVSHSQKAVGLELALNHAKKRVKFRRIEHSTESKLMKRSMNSKRGMDSIDTKLKHSSTSTSRVFSKSFPKQSATMYKTAIKVATSDGFHLIKLGDKHWISKKEPPEAASFQFVSLYHNALEVLAQSCAMGDKPAMHEIAILLLQWYRTRYLRLSSSIYLHVLTTLCATNNIKFALDATHTLYKISLDGVISLEIWLKNPSYLNNFILSLRHPSPITVLKCAHLVAYVLKQAESNPKTNIFLLITPESISAIHSSFYTWRDHYGVSEALERICVSLYTLERSTQNKRIHDQKRRLAKQQGIIAWAHRQGEVIKSIVRSAESAQTAISTRFAQSIREFRVQGGFSRRLSLSGKSISRRGSIQTYRTRTSVENTDDTFSQCRSLKDGGVLQLSIQSYSKVMDSVGYTPPHEQHTHKNNNGVVRFHVDLSQFLNEPSKNLSPAEPRLGQVDVPDPVPRKPFESILHNDLQLEPGLKNLQLTFVTTAILTEIDRRHSLRCQFEILLRRTRLIYEEVVRKPDGITWLTSVRQANGKERNRFKNNPNHEIIDGFSRLIEMFKHSQGCAMEDFVKNGMDAELSTFFKGHIKPLAAALAKPAKGPWKFLSF
ncbi:hypothetical protein THRCLA_06714 [Thraustotheca clavata]|uniref:Uncharacterized protein n=1 Tax=Thraustotheca clavata TaxID=74557 RepID=A0A1V9ZKA0_9STRA|nr:hypothetical protein THRCLA_06714 [Thraustotheca clavata]